MDPDREFGFRTFPKAKKGLSSPLHLVVVPVSCLNMNRFGK